MAKRQPLPKTQYPTTPHVVGIDWIEVPVARPIATAATYCAMGFEPRLSINGSPRVAIGGTVLLLRRSSRRQASGVTIQAAVQDIGAKRKHLLAMGLKPGRLIRLKRGDAAFTWRDPDGHTIRFVGPVRRPSDKMLD